MINNYLFTFNDEDHSVQYAFKSDTNEESHDKVVREFLQFLSSIYGYDLGVIYLDNTSSDT
jgi:uncharacterized protein YggL (DUF469 family)